LEAFIHYDTNPGEGGKWNFGKYYYYVTAYKGSEESPSFEIKWVDPPPTAPQNLVFTNSNTEMQHPHLTWNENTERDIAGYEVWREYWEKFSGYTETVKIASVPYGTTSYTDNEMYTASHETGYYLVYWVKAVDLGGNISSPSNSVGSYAHKMPKVGRTDEMFKLREEIPVAYGLRQNYPNPFNPTTSITYQIPEARQDETVWVSLKVYDMLGREVVTLVEGPPSTGHIQCNV